MDDLQELRNILDDLLSRDQDITARAIARVHSSIKAASSITRISSRRELLTEYQDRQTNYRTWRGKSNRRPNADIVKELAEKSQRLQELESQLQLLAASHVALVRVVGEMGGFPRWVKFFSNFRAARQLMMAIGALDVSGLEKYD